MLARRDEVKCKGRRGGRRFRERLYEEEPGKRRSKWGERECKKASLRQAEGGTSFKKGWPWAASRAVCPRTPGPEARRRVW